MESNHTIIGYQLLRNAETAQKQKQNLLVYKNPMEVLRNYPPACAVPAQAQYAMLHIDREHILEYKADAWIVGYFKIVNILYPRQYLQHCVCQSIRNSAKILTQRTASNVAYCDRNERVAVAPGSISIAASTGASCISKSLGIYSIAGCVGSRSAALAPSARSIAACVGTQSFAYQEGEGGLAVSIGRHSEAQTDYHGVAFAMGVKGVASGSYGCWIGCAEYADDDVTIIDIKFAFVDDVKIKENVRYCLQNGEFVPVDER